MPCIGCDAEKFRALKALISGFLCLFHALGRILHYAVRPSLLLLGVRACDPILGGRFPNLPLGDMSEPGYVCAGMQNQKENAPCHYTKQENQTTILVGSSLRMSQTLWNLHITPPPNQPLLQRQCVRHNTLHNSLDCSYVVSFDVAFPPPRDSMTLVLNSNKRPRRCLGQHVFPKPQIASLCACLSILMHCGK